MNDITLARLLACREGDTFIAEDVDESELDLLAIELDEEKDEFVNVAESSQAIQDIIAGVEALQAPGQWNGDAFFALMQRAQTTTRAFTPTLCTFGGMESLHSLGTAQFAMIEGMESLTESAKATAKKMLDVLRAIYRTLVEYIKSIFNRHQKVNADLKATQTALKEIKAANTKIKLTVTATPAFNKAFVLEGSALKLQPLPHPDDDVPKLMLRLLADVCSLKGRDHIGNLSTTLDQLISKGKDVKVVGDSRLYSAGVVGNGEYVIETPNRDFSKTLPADMLIGYLNKVSVKFVFNPKEQSGEHDVTISLAELDRYSKDLISINMDYQKVFDAVTGYQKQIDAFTKSANVEDSDDVFVAKAMSAAASVFSTYIRTASPLVAAVSVTANAFFTRATHSLSKE